jgi:phage virion morphogenesis protein
MAGTALSFKAENGPLVSHLARLAARQQWTSARREIGEYLLGDIQDNIHKQKLADGSPMPQSKAAIKRAGKTLIASHNLYDSYVYQLARGGVEVGSAKVYAAIHHFGGKTGRGGKTNIVARPVMGIGERQERRIGDFLIAEIKAMQ